MNHELVALVEREVLAWPGVNKEARDSRFGDVVIYWYGKRQLGHIHDDDVADVLVPKAIRDELVAAGRAMPHRGGFAAVVSYELREPRDVAGAVELFRLTYDRAKASADKRAAAA